MNARSCRRVAGSLHLSLAISLFCTPHNAVAQYLYLDSNDDGFHTSVDAVNPHGPTRIGLWLVTNRNRDGTPAPCATGATIAQPDFRVVLVVTNGTVSWGKFVPYEKNLHDYEPVCDDSSRYVVWYGLPSAMHPGRHYLGEITVTTTSGTPAIGLGEGCPVGHEQFTGFSSQCGDGAYYDEHILGQGFEGDGLPFGGVANTPPQLATMDQFPVRAGAEARYRITAHDKDGDPITFRLGSALQRLASPDFITVRTIDPGRGEAIGEVVLRPDSCTEGTWLFAVEAWDGTWSDHYDVGAPVQRTPRPVPDNPMGPPRQRVAAKHQPWRDVVPDRPALDGEWEWTGSGVSTRYFGSRFPPARGPVQAGKRRRLVMSADKSYSMYELKQGGVRMTASGEYTLGREAGTATIQFDQGSKYAIARIAPDTLSLYPWGAHDASADYYVYVPPLVRNPSRIDTLALLAPTGLPKSGPIRGIPLHASLREAMRRYDSSFRPYTSGDWPFPGNIEFDETPWAGLGDFDGDLMQDLAVYGRSGKDEVVLALLSGFGRTRVVEVARRPASMKWPHPYLEIVPRGTKYPPCWARMGVPETDAIGIVSPGVARFDYGLLNGEFVVYAPVP